MTTACDSKARWLPALVLTLIKVAEDRLDRRKKPRPCRCVECSCRKEKREDV
jgi:hypothetical protein